MSPSELRGACGSHVSVAQYVRLVALRLVKLDSYRAQHRI